MYLLVVMYGGHICKRGLLISIFNCMKLHRQSHTKSDGGGKRIYFSCRRFLLSAPVCTARHHSGIVSVRFAFSVCHFYVLSVMGLWKNFTLSFIPWRGIFVQKMSEKIKNSVRTFWDFWTQRGLGGNFPLQAIFSSFRLWGNWINSACEGTQAVLAILIPTSW